MRAASRAATNNRASLVERLESRTLLSATVNELGAKAVTFYAGQRQIVRDVVQTWASDGNTGLKSLVFKGTGSVNVEDATWNPLLVLDTDRDGRVDAGEKKYTGVVNGTSNIVTFDLPSAVTGNRQWLFATQGDPLAPKSGTFGVGVDYAAFVCGGKFVPPSQVTFCKRPVTSKVAPAPVGPTIDVTEVCLPSKVNAKRGAKGVKVWAADVTAFGGDVNLDQLVLQASGQTGGVCGWGFYVNGKRVGKVTLVKGGTLYVDGPFKFLKGCKTRVELRVDIASNAKLGECFSVTAKTNYTHVILARACSTGDFLPGTVSVNKPVSSYKHLWTDADSTVKVV